MIGTREDATLAVNQRLDILSNEGLDRIVYRKGNVVYKVDRNPNDSENEEEWIRYSHIDYSLVPDNVVIPETQLYWVNTEAVIAMEYVEGDPIGECISAYGDIECDDAPCIDADTCEAIKKATDVTDLSHGNLRVHNGRYYLIDMAY